MDNLRVIATWLLFSCIALQGWCQCQSLRADIKAAQTLVKSGETFRVGTAIRNAGTTEQTIIVFTCTWSDQWIVDNPAVDVNSNNCLSNVQEKIKLKPGEAYENSLMVHIGPATDQSVRREMTFRLGFDTTGYFGTRKPDQKVIWSNPVTVTVISD